MLSKEEIKQIKSQLLKQIESWPQEKQESAIEQINSMNEGELEEFLVKNNLIKSGDNSSCIFCSIIENKIPSYKIAENKSAIAILEINPISSGHTIIIPKQHLNKKELPQEIIDFSEEISSLLQKKLAPEKVDIFPSEMFGHGIINVLPVYYNETSESKRKKAEDSELQELQEKLTNQKIKEEIIIEAEKPKKIYKFPRRIP